MIAWRPPGLLCALFLAACAATPVAPPSAAGAPGAGLAGTRWVGVVEPAADPRTLPRLEFVGEGRVTGYTGCNMLSGSWRMEGGEARLGPLATTKRMCLGPEGEVEQRFLRALGEGSRGRREGERLVFTGAGGARFEFARAS
ncbi:MAG TPA: META domain-containing protein [Myxococcota bacterium]|nr:META domain-containing protein [Myxococcota bacterium]